MCQFLVSISRARAPKNAENSLFFLTFPTKCLVGSKNVVTFALANQQYVDGEVAQLVRAQDS